MYIDIIFVFIVALACYKGIKKGFIGSIISFTAFFIGFFIATKFAATVAVYLTKHQWVNNKWIPFLSFILVLTLVFLAMHLLGKILEKSAELIMLGWFNKLIGLRFEVYNKIVSYIFAYFKKKRKSLRKELIF